MLPSRIFEIVVSYHSHFDPVLIAHDCVRHDMKKIMSQKNIRFKMEKVIDACGMDPEEVRSWLKTLPIQSEIVNVYWVSCNEGMIIPFSEFIRFYDDLWFPSSDDVWITTDAHIWLVELSHEEIISYWVVDSVAFYKF